jgi:hypothetical protein
MTKRKKFEEILETEFRWPAEGDRPFVTAENPHENANIASDEFTRLVLMMEGYKKAADLMVVEASTHDHSRDFLVFPIIFNYRQFLELSLKYQLATYGPAVGVDPNWKTHDLIPLWAAFLKLLEGYGTEDPDEADPIVGEIILQFAKIDPASYSHRYPVDKKGKAIPVEQADLHLETLADVMNAVHGYFSGCDGYLSALLDASS